MAQGEVQLKVALVGEDKLGAVILKAQKQMERFGKKSENSTKGAKRGFAQLSGTIKGLPGRITELNQSLGVVQKAFMAVGATVRRTFQAIESGELANNVQKVFGQMNTSYAVSMKKLTEATRGLVDDTSLHQASNKMRLLGADIDQIAELMGHAATISLATGQDLISVAEQMTSAAVSGRKQSLQLLGVTVDLVAEVEKLAIAQGKTIEEMTEQEKIELRLAVVSDALGKRMVELGINVADLGTNAKTAKTDLANLISTAEQFIAKGIMGELGHVLSGDKQTADRQKDMIANRALFDQIRSWENDGKRAEAVKYLGEQMGLTTIIERKRLAELVSGTGDVSKAFTDLSITGQARMLATRRFAAKQAKKAAAIAATKKAAEEKKAKEERAALELQFGLEDAFAEASEKLSEEQKKAREKAREARRKAEASFSQKQIKLQKKASNAIKMLEAKSLGDREALLEKFNQEAQSITDKRLSADIDGETERLMMLEMSGRKRSELMKLEKSEVDRRNEAISRSNQKLAEEDDRRREMSLEILAREKEAYEDFSNTLGFAAGEMGRFSSTTSIALAGVADISAAVGQNLGDTPAMARGAISATGSMTTALIRDTKTAAATKSAFEFASGLAALAGGNLVGMSAHFASGAAFAAIAGGAGGKKKGKGGGSSGKVLRAGGGGGGGAGSSKTSSVVVNVQGFVLGTSKDMGTKMASQMSEIDGTGLGTAGV